MLKRNSRLPEWFWSAIGIFPIWQWAVGLVGGGAVGGLVEWIGSLPWWVVTLIGVLAAILVLIVVRLLWGKNDSDSKIYIRQEGKNSSSQVMTDSPGGIQVGRDYNVKNPPRGGSGDGDDSSEIRRLGARLADLAQDVIRAAKSVNDMSVLGEATMVPPLYVAEKFEEAQQQFKSARQDYRAELATIGSQHRRDALRG